MKLRAGNMFVPTDLGFEGKFPHASLMFVKNLSDHTHKEVEVSNSLLLSEVVSLQ